MAKEIYLDNSMATRPSPAAVSSMLPILQEKWGTPSAPHRRGQELFDSMAESYKAIYNLLGAKDSDSFVFTSSGAEAVNQVILSAYFNITLNSSRNHFLTSHIDEAAAIMSIGRLTQLGCSGTMVYPNRSGIITAEILAEAITPRTALISLSWANGLTGSVNPIEQIAKLCRERAIALHIDISHLLGKLYFDLEEIDADFITFNGDQIHAPRGTGGLWIKGGSHCSPLINGGIEQGGLRAGHLNVAALVALGHAAKEALESRDYLCTEVARLRDKFEMGIVAHDPEAVPLFRDCERLPHITAIAFPGVLNEALLYCLNKKGIFASIGGGSFQQIAQVLKASGLDDSVAQTAISFALSRETSESEINSAIAIIAAEAKRLRTLSCQRG